MTTREASIDALRGISIVAVLVYHYQSFFPGLYGVLLFFMISGYCMPASLGNSISLRHFLAKRFARLIPALVVCGLITTVVEKVANVRPDRLHSWADWVKASICLPLVDLPCQLSGVLLGKFHQYAYPDGAYWTLAVEFKFYLLIGLLFFMLRSSYVRGFAILVALAPWCIGQGKWLDDFLPYLPAFLLGVSVARWKADNRLDAATGLAGVVASMVAMTLLHIHPYSMPMVSTPSLIAFAVTGMLLFLASRYVTDVRPLVWLGLISYPLYLLHQDIGLVLFEFNGSAPMRWIFAPAALICIAYLVHVTVEHRYRGLLTAIIVYPPKHFRSAANKGSPR